MPFGNQPVEGMHRHRQGFAFFGRQRHATKQQSSPLKVLDWSFISNRIVSYRYLLLSKSRKLVPTTRVCT
jgi:hypothetical protein